MRQRIIRFAGLPDDAGAAEELIEHAKKLGFTFVSSVIGETVPPPFTSVADGTTLGEMLELTREDEIDVANLPNITAGTLRRSRVADAWRALCPPYKRSPDLFFRLVRAMEQHGVGFADCIPSELNIARDGWRRAHDTSLKLDTIFWGYQIVGVPLLLALRQQELAELRAIPPARRQEMFELRARLQAEACQ